MQVVFHFPRRTVGRAELVLHRVAYHSQEVERLILRAIEGADAVVVYNRGRDRVSALPISSAVSVPWSSLYIEWSPSAYQTPASRAIRIIAILAVDNAATAI